MSRALDEAEYCITCTLHVKHQGCAAALPHAFGQHTLLPFECSSTRGSAEQLPPYLVAVVNIEAGRHSGSQEVAAIWSPVTCHCHIVPA